MREKKGRFRDLKVLYNPIMSKISDLFPFFSLFIGQLVGWQHVGTSDVTGCQRKV